MGKDIDYTTANLRPFQALTRGANWRVAKWNEADGSWSVFTGKNGGKFRKYKSLRAMDAAMARLGMARRGQTTRCAERGS